MVPTKKIAKEYIQKQMKKKFICFTSRNQLKTKEENNAENERQIATRHMDNKWQDD